ncbi:MAG: tRNA-binding protein [Deltaproteobacteria bacterium]|nr:tRNA-binding protein [Deltaproteobacteria bacterium]
MAQITYDDFLRVDIRVGVVTRVEEFPKARRPAYKVWVDFGPEIGQKKTSAQVTRLYEPADLLGRQVLGVVNFPPRQIADFMSEFLLLGAMPDEETVVLVHPDREVGPGSRLL